MGIIHNTAIVGADHPNRQVSANAWNDEHLITGDASTVLSFDVNGNVVYLPTSSVVNAGSSVSDITYGLSWNGDTTNAPSKNAVYDQIETRIPFALNTFWGAGYLLNQPSVAITISTDPVTKGSLTMYGANSGLNTGGFQASTANDGGSLYFGGQIVNNRIQLAVTGTITGVQFNANPYVGTNVIWNAGNFDPASKANVFSFATASDIRTGTNATKTIAADQLVAAAAPQTLTDGATITWNMALGFNAKVTLGGNRTLATPTNPFVGLTYALQIIQDGTGSRTLTWPASTIIDWGSVGAPTLSTSSGKNDFVFLYCYDATTPAFRSTFNKAS